MNSEHGWNVRMIVQASPDNPMAGVARYLGTCTCGWEGVLQTSETYAATDALDHCRRARQAPDVMGAYLANGWTVDGEGRWQKAGL
jgi:hypothetical protein